MHSNIYIQDTVYTHKHKVTAKDKTKHWVFAEHSFGQSFLQLHSEKSKCSEGAGVFMYKDQDSPGLT